MNITDQSYSISGYSEGSECAGREVNPILQTFMISIEVDCNVYHWPSSLFFFPSFLCRSVLHEGSSFRWNTDAVDVILFADELFRGDHELVESEDDPECRSDTNCKRSTSGKAWSDLEQPQGT